MTVKHPKRGPNAHNGGTDLIKRCLVKGPASVERISVLTGLTRDIVKSRLSCMIGRTGGVVPVPDSKPRQYALPGTITKPIEKSPGKKAGHITIGRQCMKNWPSKQNSGRTE